MLPVVLGLLFLEQARCASLADANAAATVLQAKWYNASAGGWPDAGWWNSANAVESLSNLMIYGNTTTYEADLDNVFSKQPASEILTAQYNDDIQWWALGWIRLYRKTGKQEYLDRAKLVFFHLITTVWDDHCGGGMWWSYQRTYKNAITNELFLALSMNLHLHAHNDKNSSLYLDWARKEWAWFSKSGMINSQNMVNDGLTSNCQNNNGTTWTYNQGVILSGLGMLSRVDGNIALVHLATDIADAATKNLVYPSGVLREPCELTKNCDNDADQFKGIFIRHLRYLMDEIPSVAPRYTKFIATNAQSIYANDNSNGQYGVYWVGPYQQANSVTQTAALDAFNSAGM